MRKGALFFLIFLSGTAFSALASADVAPRCKCEAAGAASPLSSGGAVAAFVVAGASLVVVARKRGHKS
jgi:hypothetical protein